MLKEIKQWLVSWAQRSGSGTVSFPISFWLADTLTVCFAWRTGVCTVLSCLAGELVYSLSVLPSWLAYRYIFTARSVRLAGLLVYHRSVLPGWNGWRTVQVYLVLRVFWLAGVLVYLLLRSVGLPGVLVYLLFRSVANLLYFLFRFFWFAGLQVYLLLRPVWPFIISHPCCLFWLAGWRTFTFTVQFCLTGRRAGLLTVPFWLAGWLVYTYIYCSVLSALCLAVFNCFYFVLSSCFLAYLLFSVPSVCCAGLRGFVLFN